ncbi:Sodium/calcium exchanger domain containing protein [Lactarius tabidus]
MSPTEQSPLLDRRTFAEGEPSWLDSYRWLLFSSWLNLLLPLVPVAAAAHYLNWDAPLRFGSSFLAIIPLAKLLGDATEQMSLSLGQTYAGLLNATFGNAIEITVGVTALLRDEFRLVQTAMLGSILSNILFILGCSFMTGGIYHHESEFQKTAAQTSASLMALACITLVVPAAYHGVKRASSFGNGNLVTLPGSHIYDPDEDAQKGLNLISHGTAILLLGVYIGYLIFQLKTHPNLFVSKRKETDAHVGEPIEVEEEPPRMGAVAGGVGLLVSAVMTSFVADYLVASIEETAERYEIPKTFIGLILMPFVTNAAANVTAMRMARKDHMELVVGICMGSSIQIATFVIPLLVMIGWITGHELTLFFLEFEIITFFVAVLLVNLLVQDGKSNYMEGLMLITLYLVIALSLWVP